MRGLWRQNCLFRRIGLSAAAMPVLVIDDTAIPKKGTHSVGVAPQYASALGKTANCQDAGAAVAWPRGSTGHAGVPVVSSVELDKQPGSPDLGPTVPTNA